ncbi:protein tyrosine/serine phosphatase [Candidatus Protofrankia californiensis]|uniref:Protein tyrosine/serine phosphatase n=1 Tax=Candidatus Protofrankia californiensis TaxID=1839754 RepID=A0A1C3NVB5_9ACTN|nr:protein tyrosine/serine phosphatase [Candidatus Protofrankia californiensis]
MSFTFDGLFNFRDLGGLALNNDQLTRHGLVFRSDALDNLSPGDRRCILDKVGIGVIVDLRTAEEAGGDGLQDQRIFPELETYHLSVMPEGRIGREPFPDGRDPGALAEGYYKNLIEGAPTIGKIFGVIADSLDKDVPVLFHCAAGRDRTGLIAAILLSLVGVRNDEIARDFVRSNHHAHHIAARLEQNPLYGASTEAGLGLGPALLQAQTMEIFLELLRSRNGGASSWAASTGIPTPIIDALCAGLAPDIPDVTG